MIKITTGGVCAAKGFTAGGVHCGIRKNKSKKQAIYREKELKFVFTNECWIKNNKNSQFLVN